MKTKILDLEFDSYTMEEVIEIANEFLNNGKANYIVTPNTEMCMVARNDKNFTNILNNADLVIPDGIGIVFASKLNKIKIKERVAGYDFVKSFFVNNKKEKLKVYMLGSKPGVTDKAKKNIEKEFKKVEIVGHRDGYFKEEDEKDIVKEISNLKPDLLLVALGMKKQENFIFKYKDMLNSKVCIGVGGSIDVFAGEVKRAPEIFIKLNLEWFYRLLKQPSRFFRMLSLPKFILVVIIEKLKGEKN